MEQKLRNIVSLFQEVVSGDKLQCRVPSTRIDIKDLCNRMNVTKEERINELQTDVVKMK